MASVTVQTTNLPMSSFLNSLKPWVSIVCTCYNHETFVEEALQSVVEQDYPNVELIVIDNGSTDQSADRIARFVVKHPAVRFVKNPTNIGLNRAFNQGFALTTGRYIIDLAADDVLLADRIRRQVDLFERLPTHYAVVFSNAAFIDSAGQRLGTHYPIDSNGRSKVRVPSGDVFSDILDRYFVCTPTMMMRREILDELGGYDESLAFEDFDFWVRSSRSYHYAYLDDVLTYKRRLPNSMSTQVTHRHNELLASSLIVCQRAYDVCHSADEQHILARRVGRFVRKAFYAEQFDLALRFGHLLSRIQPVGPSTRLFLGMSYLHLPVNGVYRRFQQWQQARQLKPAGAVPR